MEGQDNPVAGCIIFLIFIVFNSIFYGFGSAIQHINENDVELKAQEGDKKKLPALKDAQQAGRSDQYHSGDRHVTQHFDRIFFDPKLFRVF